MNKNFRNNPFSLEEIIAEFKILGIEFDKDMGDLFSYINNKMEEKKLDRTHLLGIIQELGAMPIRIAKTALETVAEEKWTLTKNSAIINWYMFKLTGKKEYKIRFFSLSVELNKKREAAGTTVKVEVTVTTTKAAQPEEEEKFSLDLSNLSAKYNNQNNYDYKKALQRLSKKLG